MSEAQPKLAKARLIPIEGDRPDPTQHVEVHFNPQSLKVSLSNTIKADTKAKGQRGSAAQFVDKSSSTLAVELVFDTSTDQSDVRAVTQRIAEWFVKPQGDGEKPDPPKRCRFQWGAFAFDGMVSSYDETLDFFAPEGIPLRSNLSLTLQEDKYQFQRDESVRAARRDLPTFTGTANDTPLPEANQAAGADPRDWRETALYNGIEDPRAPGASGVAVPNSPPSPAGRDHGYRYGESDRLGTGIPGAFPDP